MVHPLFVWSACLSLFKLENEKGMRHNRDTSLRSTYY